MLAPPLNFIKSWRRSLLKDFLNFEIRHIVPGILGVAIGVAGLLLSFSDGKILYLQRSLSNVEFMVAGLQNLGNNCFLNVILQALASCRSFSSFMRNTLEIYEQDMEETAEKFPLNIALLSLLDELCIVREKRVVLSPRKVILAMSSYVSNFNLTRQQDASEALLLLLSSLEEELFYHYTTPGSLTEIYSSCKISYPKLLSEDKSECQLWKEGRFGQFDGIIGSLLTCGSCSSQLSLDFEFFRCLNITPLFDRNGFTKNECTLDDSLKHFTTTEHLENYCCHRCSHIKALKYLSLRPDENKEKINLIGQCVRYDSCNCSRLFAQNGLPWPKGSSCTSKKLMIARPPKILCLHLQRALMDPFGKIIKTEGHVGFPLLLDLFPFSAAAKMQLGNFSAAHTVYERDTTESPSSQSFLKETDSSNFVFQLASVVEHYGRPGSGHYAVYRRLRVDFRDPSFVGNTQHCPPDQWLYISDHKVSLVSEADVLAAEASLLFYERFNATTDSSI